MTKKQEAVLHIPTRRIHESKETKDSWGENFSRVATILGPQGLRRVEEGDNGGVQREAR